MQLVGYFNEQYPGLHFEPDIIAGLAKYSLSVDFDFYFHYLESDGPEDAEANKRFQRTVRTLRYPGTRHRR
jgi:hypothetical protein